MMTIIWGSSCYILNSVAAKPSLHAMQCSIQSHCKVQVAHAGRQVKAGFEGGQTPLKQRVPKRGFHNKCDILISALMGPVRSLYFKKILAYCSMQVACSKTMHDLCIILVGSLRPGNCNSIPSERLE